MIDHDKLKKTRAGARAGTGWKVKDGENKVRILPPRSAFLTDGSQMSNLAIPYDVHFFQIEGRRPTEFSRCLRDLKQPCPACSMFWTWQKSTDPAMAQLAKRVRATTQYLFNILDLGNVAAGVQAWAANWTCWDKVMEIAGNPLWGDVVDPSNGINFAVNLTPQNRSKSGYNQYSVLPEPQRTSIMNILQGIPNWEQALDHLEDQIPAAKTVDEINKLLSEMGFPPASGVATPPSAGAGYSAPAPMPAAPQPMPMPAPMPVPTPVAPPKAQASALAPQPPVPVAPPRPIGFQTPAPSVHYDPGPDYKEPVSASERPEGAPRCFGGYNPDMHKLPDGTSACQPCPAVTDCQLRMLGIVG